MGMMECASRLTHKTFTASGSAGALTVAGGEPVKVVGIVFKAVTAAVFTVTDASDNALWTYAVAANSGDSVEIPWVADIGIKIQTNQTDGAATVFHQSPGS